jgi:hypothetical protein
MKEVLAVIHRKKRFDSYAESEQLEQEIESLIKAGEVEEIPVDTPEHPLLEEHWYREIKTGVVYRYCPPEFPARGVWEEVTT